MEILEVPHSPLRREGGPFLVHFSPVVSLQGARCCEWAWVFSGTTGDPHMVVVCPAIGDDHHAISVDKMPDQAAQEIVEALCVMGELPDVGESPMVGEQERG